jgi:hypothetical protein
MQRWDIQTALNFIGGTTTKPGPCEGLATPYTSRGSLGFGD